MARYEVQSPDGKAFEVEGPDDATDEQISNFAAQQFGHTPVPAATSGVPRGTMDRFGTGALTALKQRALGIAQLAMEASGNSGGNTYKDSLDLAKNYAAEQKGGGVAGFVGEMAGDPLTYVGGGAAKAGMAGVKLASRAAAKQLAKVGAVTGEVYGGLEPVKEDTTNRLENVAVSGAEGAIAAPVIGSVAPAVIKNVVGGTGNLVRGVTAMDEGEQKAAQDALQAQGNATFTAMRNQGMVFKPRQSTQIVTGLRDDLENNTKLTKGTHSGTLQTMKDFEKDLLTQRNIGIDDLYAWRKNFSAIARDPTPANAEDARVASQAVRYIDDSLEAARPKDVVGGNTSAVDMLDQAKQQWSQYKKFDTVSDMVDRAGGNPSKQQKLATDLVRKTDGRGYTDQEFSALKDMRGKGLTNNAINLASHFGLNASTHSVDLGTSAGAGMGAIAGGLPGAAMTVAGGTAAAFLRSTLERGKAERLLKIIQAGGVIPENEVMTLPPKVAKYIMDSGFMQKTVAKPLAQGNN